MTPEPLSINPVAMFQWASAERAETARKLTQAIEDGVAEVHIVGLYRQLQRARQQVRKWMARLPEGSDHAP